MVSICITFFMVAFLGAAAGNPDATQKLVRVFYNTTDQAQLLIDLHHSNPNLDFWSHPNRFLDPILVQSNSENHEKLSQFLQQNGLESNLVSDNVQKMFQEDLENLQQLQSRSGSFNLFTYHDFNDHLGYGSSIRRSNPDRVTVETIAKTHEKRPINVLKITNGDKTSKPIAIVECGMHAREWVSPATCLYIIDDLLNNNNSLINKFDFHVIPIANPDGYSYTWTADRSWRKNRSPQQAAAFYTCQGVDTNRNFDMNFGKAGISWDPCSLIFCGRTAFSEVESRAVRDYVNKVKDDLVAYFALHSFTQLWMYPYGSGTKELRNKEQLHKMSEAAAEAMFKLHGEEYRIGDIQTTVYPASGSSLDWVYDNTNVTIAFALEMRDKGEYGFRLPPRLIKPAAEEAWVGMQTTLNMI